MIYLCKSPDSIVFATFENTIQLEQGDPSKNSLLHEPRRQSSGEIVLSSENNEDAEIDEAHEHFEISHAFPARRESPGRLVIIAFE